MGVGTADKTAAKVVGNGGSLSGKLAGKGLDCPLRNPTLFGCPGRGFRNRIVFTQNVGKEFIGTGRMGAKILFVVEILRKPDMDYGELQGGVGIGQDRDPLVSVDCCPR